MSVPPSGLRLIGVLLVSLSWTIGGPFSAAADPEPQRIAPRGTVVDLDQKPVSASQLTLHRWDGTWSPALETATTDAAGTFAFAPQPKEDYHYVIVRHPGFGPWLQLAESDTPLRITLRPAVETWIETRTDTGTPLAGARVATLSIRTPENGTAYVWRGMEQSVGWTFGPSDAAGKLLLPPLPAEAVVDVRIDHPDWVQGRGLNLSVKAGSLGTVTLRAGTRMTFEFVADPRTPMSLDGLSLEATLLARSSNSAETIQRRPMTIAGNRIELTLPPARFQWVEWKISNRIVTPIYPGPPDLVVSTESAAPVRFLVRGTVPVAGRVLRPDGSPHRGARISAEIENLWPDGRLFTGGEWTYGGFAETAADGTFALRLPPGRCRIRADAEGWMTTPEMAEIDITAGQPVKIPDFTANELPPLRGRVTGLDGKPAAGVVVRLRTSSVSWMSPVVTDSEGRFEIRLQSLPYDIESHRRRHELDLAAFVADRPISGRVRVDLRHPASLQSLEISLQRETSADSIFQFEDAEWFAAQLAKRPTNAADVPRAGRPGESPPELDGAAWLNTEKRSLKDFGGRYVLLDFWFIGCGPCHADLPTVKLIHERFERLGVTVIGVHDNSSSPDTVREHAREHGLTYPIVVDHPDGRILAAYRDLGVTGFPTYLLIGPDGKILQNDDFPNGPSLRSFKLELLRKRLLAPPSP